MKRLDEQDMKGWEYYLQQKDRTGVVLFYTDIGKKAVRTFHLAIEGRAESTKDGWGKDYLTGPFSVKYDLLAFFFFKYLHESLENDGKYAGRHELPTVINIIVDPKGQFRMHSNQVVPNIAMSSRVFIAVRHAYKWLKQVRLGIIIGKFLTNTKAGDCRRRVPIEIGVQMNEEILLYLARHRMCEACLQELAITVHHIKSRGSGGKDIPENFLALGYDCDRRKAHGGKGNIWLAINFPWTRPKINTAVGGKVDYYLQTQMQKQAGSTNGDHSTPSLD